MNLDNFFRAKSVAVIGVSSSPEKVGHVIFKNLVDSHYDGKLYAVNIKGGVILGQVVYRSVRMVPGKIDMAVIAVPAGVVLKVVEECGKKGIKDIVLITSGFAEIGNVKLRDNLLKLLQKYKIRCIGPNCLGVFDAYSKLDSLFLPRYRLERPLEGGMSLVCQSGAAGSALLDLASNEGYGFAKFVSYGNAINVDEADIIEYLDKDEDTKVICLYVEGVKDGKKFVKICKKVKKPIIAIKGGVTEAGAHATLSHTGSLAGDGSVYSGIFRQCGIIEAHSLQDMFNYARVLERGVRPRGRRVQIITNGGGYGILCTDAVIENGLQMAEMDKKVRLELRKQFPFIVTVGNPMDLVGDADTNRYQIALEAALRDKNVDVIVVVLLYQTPRLSPEIVEIVSEINALQKKPIVVVSTGGAFTELLRKDLQQKGVVTFTYPKEAVAAVRVLCEYWLNK